MLRRSFIISSSALGLAACQTVDKNVAIVAADAKIITNGLAGILPQLGALGIGIPAEVATALASLQSVADSLGAATTVASAQPLVQKIETYVNTIVGALAAIPLIPPPISLVLQAASILLPVLETAVGLVINSFGASAKMRASARGMSADQARLILQGQATRR